mmetsp:Transcript_29738/g.68459  ORF Transcript_29738/g.68459 Transcript_29738/m.68459 type:complete len:1143 (+) Transcript_29738:115-3543(+)
MEAHALTVSHGVPSKRASRLPSKAVVPPPAVKAAAQKVVKIIRPASQWSDRSSEQGESEHLALNLGKGLFSLQFGRLDAAGSLMHLQVLLASENVLTTESVADILLACRDLVHLDISDCQLKALPGGSVWQTAANLKICFCHRNCIRFWEDLDGAFHAPALQWLATYQNPATNAVEFRSYALQRKHDLLALDHWIVTDGERLPALLRETWSLPNENGGRFSPQSADTILTWPTDMGQLSASVALYKVHALLQMLMARSEACSAARWIQTRWRGHSVRMMVEILQQKQKRTKAVLERRVRAFLWKRRMLQYTKQFLAEIGQLDLLLSASEMIRVRAALKIQKAAKRWLQRRSDQRRTMEAIRLIAGVSRGFVTRLAVLQEVFSFAEHPTVYVPASRTWEFLVLINLARMKCGLQPFDATHHFQKASTVAIRMPQMDEVPARTATITSLLRYTRSCILRRTYRKRYPGPFLRIRDDSAPARVKHALTAIRRRGAWVPPKGKKIFTEVVARGYQFTSAVQAAPTSLAWKSFLARPQSELPHDVPGLGPLPVLADFLQEAWRMEHLASASSRDTLELKPVQCTMQSAGAAGNDATSTRLCALDELSEQLVTHRCETPRMAFELTRMMLEYNKTCNAMVLTKHVPFLNEKMVNQIAAATIIQSAWRAQKARTSLPCGLLTAVVIRRSVLCIQRAWRWGLLKRRLELLTKAMRYVRKIRGPALYVEERLLWAMNIISSIDRYPPFVKERRLAFAYSGDLENVVLVGSQEAEHVRRSSRRSSSSGGYVGRLSSNRRLEPLSGIPAWLASAVSGLQTVGRDDPSLKRVSGVQGLLLEGLGDRAEENIVTVAVPVLSHLDMGNEEEASCSKLLAAVDGAFRFVELRFSSTARARERALMLFFCTYNAQLHIEVPIASSKALLHDSNLWKSILRSWENYSLAWPAGDRVSPYQLKRAAMQQHMQVVCTCGVQRVAGAAKLWQTSSSFAAGTVSLAAVETGRAMNKTEPAKSPSKLLEGSLSVAPPPHPKDGFNPPRPLGMAGSRTPWLASSPWLSHRWAQPAIPVSKSPRDMVAAFARTPKDEQAARSDEGWQHRALSKSQYGSGATGMQPNQSLTARAALASLQLQGNSGEVFWSPRSARSQVRALPPLEV